jgi:DNA repair exonuclease SbcCD nuclease subunit
MAVKLLFIKDPHYRFGFQKPLGRQDSFQAEIDAKVDFVQEYAVQNKVDAVCYTGDLTDKKNPSDYLATQLISNEKSMSKITVPQYTIFGNHDLPASSIQLKDRSVLNYFMGHNVIKPLPFKSGKVIVHGIDFIENPDEHKKALDALHESMSEDDINIVVMHQHYVPPFSKNAELKFIHFNTYSDLYEYEKVSVFVMGHLHMGFETTYRELPNGKKQIFVNPWSMTRLSRNYYAVNELHTPEMVEVTIDGDEINWKHVIIPHTPYSEAFNDAEVKQSEIFHDKMQKFIESMSNQKLSTSATVTCPKHIEGLVAKYIEKARE